MGLLRCMVDKGGEGKSEWQWPPISSKVRANQNHRQAARRTQLTICNRKPPILLLHLELALTLCLSILLVFVHLLLLFAGLRPGLFMLLGGVRL